MKQRVVAAMSGGVDSSVAALLLSRQGYDVVGVSMQVFDYRRNHGSLSRATCCAPSDFGDARRVAAKVGFPYYVFDFEESFFHGVIKPFVEAYESGRTPNPCVECNSKIKFRELRARASSLGAAYVATGHYARVKRSEGGYRLARAKDRSKDQSYFLYGLREEELEHTLFPLADLTKPEVRNIAREEGLATADKDESQDICFVSGRVGDFLNGAGVRRSHGDIVTSSGRKVGSHDGVHRFTVGQRRGINVGGSSEPLYVIGIDPATRRVTVGGRGELERRTFRVSDLNLFSKAFGSSPVRCLAQLRYRHAGTEVSAERISEREMEVTFLSGWTPVSPGQAAVFYDLNDDEVLGGGKITRDELSPGIIRMDQEVHIP